MRTEPFPPGLLISIVENAITHGLEPTAEGGSVRVEAHRESNRLVVAVTDTGVGLKAAGRPGQGVGLANVRDRIAALFGSKGRFSLVEAPPHGARAAIEVPLARAARDPPCRRRSSPRTSRCCGRSSVARLATAWPELEIVAEAANGDEALAQAAEFRPDIAFLDIRMPVRSGLEVAREIGGGCHVVFVTAYDEYAVAAFDEGAVDYVLKPPTPERIAKVVARLKARLAAAPLDLSALLAKLAPRDGAAAPLKWIRASLGASMQMIAVDDVVYFQADDKYTQSDHRATVRR